MSPGETPLDAPERAVAAVIDDGDIHTAEPSADPDDLTLAHDLDPLLSDTTVPPARTSSAGRRWWQRILEWDAPRSDAHVNGNGHGRASELAGAAGASGAGALVEPGDTHDLLAGDQVQGGWLHDGAATTFPERSPAEVDGYEGTAVSFAAPGAEELAAEVTGPSPAPSKPRRIRRMGRRRPPAVAAEPDAPATEAPPAAAEDLLVEPSPDEWAEPGAEADRDDQSAPDELAGADDWAEFGALTEADHQEAPTVPAFVPAGWAPPLTDLPDDVPSELELAPLERSRTGEIPRVPLLAAERARLEPEPVREPTWLQRQRARRPRVRRVTRVVRRVDAWTVFKVALLFWIVAYLVLLVAGVLLWSVAVSTGTIDNVESFVRDLLALDSFTFDGQKIFRASWVLGIFMAIAGTGVTVTMAVLYNLFADLVGGVRVTVLEEEVVQRPPSGPR